MPGVTETDIERVAARAGRAGMAGSNPIIYLGTLLFADDDLVLCLFRGPSRAAVIQASEQIQASERLGIPCERLMRAGLLALGRASLLLGQRHVLGFAVLLLPFGLWLAGVSWLSVWLLWCGCVFRAACQQPADSHARGRRAAGHRHLPGQPITRLTRPQHSQGC